MFEENRRWVLTDFGAVQFLTDQVKLQQAVQAINQLIAIVNQQQQKINLLEKTQNARIGGR